MSISRSFCLELTVPFRMFFLAGVLVPLSVMGPMGSVFAQTTLDHFSWSPLPATEQAGQPFQATLQAVDVTDVAVPDFNGSVTLTAITPNPNPSVLITEVKPTSVPAVEFSNLSGNPVDVSGWRAVFYDTLSWPSPRTAFTMPSGTICPGGGVFQVNGSGFNPGAYPSFAVGVGVSWSLSSNVPVAVLLLDASNNMVDFFCAGQPAFPGLIAVPAPIPNTVWSGPPFKVTSSLSTLTFQRVGSMNHHNAADWVQATNSFGLFNQNLAAPFLADSSSLGLAPSQVDLTNGQWTGQITVGAGAATVILRADDTVGHAGDSTPFTTLPLPALALQIPHAAFKATPGVAGLGLATIPQALSNDISVTLSSSLPSEIGVLASVLISAGQTNATFNVNNFNDGLLTGPVAVTLMASAPGFAPASDVITNYDQSPPTLSVALPATIFEGTATSGRVNSSAPAAVAVRIGLSAAPAGRLQVPDSVILPAGQTTVTFGLVAPDNNLIDGNQQVTVSASVAGWTAGQGQTLVRDNENTNLALSFPSQVTAGTGLLTNAGTVSISGVLTSNLVVNLSNNFPAKLELPPHVTIAAGQTSATFDVIVRQDTLHDGNQIVTITASATNFTGTARGVLVVDSELSTFVVSTLPSAEIAGRPFTVTVYAENISGTVLSGYSGNANLSASGNGGKVAVQPTTVGPFTNGIWGGMVTVPLESLGTVLKFDDGQAHAGLSGSFDVVAVRASNLPVSDFLYDPLHKKILVGVLGSYGPNGKSVMAIDPLTGGTNSIVPINNDPGRLALSSDSQFLYAGQAGPGGVARINLNSNAVDLRFNLGTGEGGSATDMAVPPGDPHALVAWRNLSTSQGLALYRDGVQNPSIIGPGPFFNDVYKLVFYDNSTNFYSISSAGSGVWLINVISNGLNVVSTISGFNSGCVYAGGLLFSTTGDVIDPLNFRHLGAFPVIGLVAADPNVGQVYFLSGNVLQIYDLGTFAKVGQINLPITGTGTKIVSCGSGVLGISTANQIFLLQSSLIPVPAPTDLSITQSTSSGMAVVGSNFTYSITVSNAGPVTAVSAIMEDVLPADAVLVSAANSQGACTMTNGILRCQLGTLAPGTAQTTTVTMQPATPGSMINRAWALGDGINPTNGTSVATNSAVFGPTLPAITRLWLNSLSLACDTNRNVLWASDQRYSGAAESGLRSIDLGSGLPLAGMSIGFPVGRIAISANQNYLYVVYTNAPNNRIRRLNLVSNIFDLDFPVVDSFNQQHTVLNMIGTPGYPSDVLVGRLGPQNDIALYENGVAIKRAPSDTGPGRMEVNPAIPARFYRLAGVNLDQLIITNTAINVVNSANLYPGLGPSDIRLGGGFLFADTGMVVDPEAMTNVTQLPVSGLVQTDPASGLAFYLVQSGTNWVLSAFDLQTLSPAWSALVPGVTGIPASLTRCTPGILAFNTRADIFSTADQLFLLNTAQLPHNLQADLSIAQTVSAVSITTNAAVTFTTTISNAGPSAAINVVVTNQFPPDAVIVSTTASQGTVANMSNNIICSLGNLPLGAVASLQVVMTLNHTGIVTNLAGIVQSTPDAVTSNNSTSTTVQFITTPVSDLSVTEFVPPGQVLSGGNFTCIVTVSNSGPSTATGVQMGEVIVSGAGIISQTASQGTTQTQNAGVLIVNLGTINAGSTATVNITLSPVGGGLFQSLVSVVGDNLDPNLANNQALCADSLSNTNGQNLEGEIPVSAADITYDPSNRVIVASTGTAGLLSNSIVGISPTDLSLIFQVPVTNRLDRVALSGDGHYAYVATSDTGGVARVDIPSRTTDLRFALNSAGAPFGPFQVEDLAVMPGLPNTLAAARGGYSGYSSAVALFDSGIQRPDVFNNLIANASYFRLAFASPTTIYTSEPQGFRVATVTATGLADQGTLYGSYTGDFAVDGGMVFLADGRVFDPNTGNLLGSFPASGPVVPDVANGRVYFLTSKDYGGYYYVYYTVRAYDLNTHAELWSVPFNTFIGYGKKMISLGTNGVAFLTDANRVFVVRASQLAQPQADVSIQATSVPSSLMLSNGTATYAFTIVNSGPWPVTGVVVSNQVPAGASFISATSSVGTSVLTNGTVIYALGTMSNGAAATITLILQPTAAGILTDSAVVTLSEPDPNTSNNVAVVQTTITPLPVPPAVSIADAVVVKPDAGVSLIVFAVALSGPSTLPISVGYQTADGTALAGINYNNAAGSLFFSPGQTNATLSLALIRGNTLAESNRYFLVNLSGFTNVVPGRTQAVATILEDHFCAVKITGTNVVKGSSGVSNAVFDITLSTSNALPVSVQYETAGGTATPGSDYAARAGTVVFPAGITNLTLGVPVFGNTLVTSNKTFFVLLSQPANGILGIDQAQATIINAFPPFVIHGLQLQSANVWISFNSVQSRAYRLERSESPGSGTWTTVLDQIVGTGNLMTVIDPASPDPQTEYYRLVQLP